MAKKEKRARIRYQEGDPKQVGTAAEYECFIFEIYDEKYGWRCVTQAQCKKALDFPNEKKNDFIHWGFLIQIAEYSKLGYKIEM